MAGESERDSAFIAGVRSVRVNAGVAAGAEEEEAVLEVRGPDGDQVR